MHTKYNGDNMEQWKQSTLTGAALIILAVIFVIVLLVVGYFIMSNIHGNDFQDDNITYVIRR